MGSPRPRRDVVVPNRRKSKGRNVGPSAHESDSESFPASFESRPNLRSEILAHQVILRTTDQNDHDTARDQIDRDGGESLRGPQLQDLRAPGAIAMTGTEDGRFPG